MIDCIGTPINSISAAEREMGDSNPDVQSTAHQGKNKPPITGTKPIRVFELDYIGQVGADELDGPVFN